MTQDLVLQTAKEMQIGSSESTPTAASGAEDATHDNYNDILATNVDQIIRAWAGKNK
jgi:hypothetical protein